MWHLNSSHLDMPDILIQALNLILYTALVSRRWPDPTLANHSESWGKQIPC